MSTDPYIGSIQWVAFDYAPPGWAFCDGSLMAIWSNTALFSLLGIRYGGDGTTTFGLPNLRGRTPMGVSDAYPLATALGNETSSLSSSQVPSHTHLLGVSDARATSTSPGPTARVAAGGHRAYVSRGAATRAMDPRAVTPAGQGLPHENMQPFLTLNAIIAIHGVFPPRP